MGGKGSGYRNLVLISQLSINVMVPIFLCIALGLWIDGKFGTWFTIPLLILGIAAGGRNAYILAMDTIRRDEYNRKKAEEEQLRKVLEKAKTKKNDRQD